MYFRWGTYLLSWNGSLLNRLPLSVPSLCGNQLQTQRRAHQDFWCQVWVSPQEVILYKYAIPRSLRSLSTRDYPIQIHTKYYLQTETWPALHLHIGYYHWNHGIYIYDITNETTASTYRLLPLEQQHLHIGYYDGSHRKEKMRKINTTDPPEN